MYYAQFRPYDVANGPGIRCSLFVSGCTHNCPGCFNGDYQRFNYGQKWNDEIEKQVLDQMSLEQIDGLTLLGGEPMQNTAGLIPLLEHLRQFLADHNLEGKKDIWVYSGYTYEQILADPNRLALLKLCDVLVDGLFVEELKDLNLRFRGSSNQRIIDIHKSLEEDRIVDYDLAHLL